MGTSERARALTGVSRRPREGDQAADPQAKNRANRVAQPELEGLESGVEQARRYCLPPAWPGFFARQPRARMTEIEGAVSVSQNAPLLLVGRASIEILTTA